MKTAQDQELLEQYRKLSKRVVEDKGDIIVIHQENGKILNYKYKTAIADMTKYVNFKLGKSTSTTQIKDIFKGFKPKQIKKQWKGLGCSMTLDEIQEIDKIMKKHGIKTHNQFIRLVLLKVIEANK